MTPCVLPCATVDTDRRQVVVRHTWVPGGCTVRPWSADNHFWWRFPLAWFWDGPCFAREQVFTDMDGDRLEVSGYTLEVSRVVEAGGSLHG